MNIKKVKQFFFFFIQYEAHLGKQQSIKSSHHDKDSTLQTQLGATYSSKSD